MTIRSTLHPIMRHHEDQLVVHHLEQFHRAHPFSMTQLINVAVKLAWLLHPIVNLIGGNYTILHYKALENPVCLLLNKLLQ